MSTSSVLHITAHFGECDPGGKVSFPTLARWIDEAACTFLSACGVASCCVQGRTHDVVCTRLLELQLKLYMPATYGDLIDVHTTATDWQQHAFTLHHVARRGDDLLFEGTAVRAFLMQNPDDPDQLTAVRTPEKIKLQCC